MKRLYTHPMQNENRIQTICLITLTVIAVAATLFVLRSLMIPFVLALFFMFMLMPIIDLQMRYLRFPRPLAVIVTLIVGISLITAFSLLASASVNQMADNAAAYEEQVKQLITKITTSLPFEWFGVQQKELVGPMLQNLGKNVGSIIGKTLNSIVNIFSNVILILIFLVFLLLSGSRKEKSQNKVWEKGEAKIKRYISSKLTLSVLLGLCVGITLKILGIELAILFGLFACILNFIPSIGPTIATILPLPVVLMMPEISFMRGLLAIAIPGLLQFVFGNFIETKVMGDSLDLHPVTVLMSLIFWGMLWGIAGMFLAVPITAVLKMIMEEIDVTKPAADLLAGRIN